MKCSRVTAIFALVAVWVPVLFAFGLVDFPLTTLADKVFLAAAFIWGLVGTILIGLMI